MPAEYRTPAVELLAATAPEPKTRKHPLTVPPVVAITKDAADAMAFSLEEAAENETEALALEAGVDHKG